MRIQTPTTPDNWLFRDSEDNRLFKKKVYLGKNDTEWDECTDEEKQIVYETHNETSFMKGILIQR